MRRHRSHGPRLLLVAVLTAALLMPVAAHAHPLGNSTANTAVAVTVHPDDVRLVYLLDLAELPALQLLQGVVDAPDGALSPEEREALAAAQCADVADALRLEVGGSRRDLTLDRAGVALPEGQAGLATLRLECALSASLDPVDGPLPVVVRDETTYGRVGWREVTARAGAGLALRSSDVPERSPSGLLETYPESALTAPRRVTSASFTVVPRSGAPATPGDAASDAEDGGQGLWETVDEWTRSWSGLVARQRLTPGLVLLGAALALVLGAGHALAPGHGKNAVAAYLVGQHGSTRQALGLGVTVAATHTLGVIVLGVVLSLTQSLTPDRLYPLLGAVSGGLFAAVGVGLLLRTLRARASGGGEGHDHIGGHGHPLSPSAGSDQYHDHGHGHHHATVPGPLTWRGLVLPGLAGGLVPSPSALVVLLGAAALGRTWLGVGLVLLYGIGMAGTLVAVGWAAARFRDGLGRRLGAEPGPVGRALAAALPLVMSGVMIAGGLALGVRALVAA